MLYSQHTGQYRFCSSADGDKTTKLTQENMAENEELNNQKFLNGDSKAGDECVTPKSDSVPVVSHFKNWIKAVALVVLLVFVPDQVSWAFGYNPAVLYKNLPSVQVPLSAETTPNRLPQTQVAGSVETFSRE